MHRQMRFENYMETKILAGCMFWRRQITANGGKKGEGEKIEYTHPAPMANMDTTPFPGFLFYFLFDCSAFFLALF